MTNRTRIHALAAAGVLLAASSSAGAAVFGSLANFDVVNDTGFNAYGFEIEIEDPSYDHTMITSVFGYDRNFGLAGGPGAVERYGVPTITDLPTGVLIRYGGLLGGPSTPSGPYNTPGDSCWPFGAGWSTATSCDHFGVSTYGQPARTTYRWIVESTPGVLTTQIAGVPGINFNYTPPAGGQPGGGAVEVEVRAEAPNHEQPENEGVWGQAFWIKTFSNKVAHNIDLGDLFRGDDDQEAAEIETEWEILQRAPAGENGENGQKFADLALADGDQAVLRRYEFYEYTGPTKPDGEADCSKNCDPDSHPEYLGRFLGAQMAGLNVNELQAPIAVVPEPGTYGLMFAGLGLVGLVVHRRK